MLNFRSMRLHRVLLCQGGVLRSVLAGQNARLLDDSIDVHEHHLVRNSDCQHAILANLQVHYLLSNKNGSELT